jgi:hypothetical protein
MEIVSDLLEVKPSKLITVNGNKKWLGEFEQVG